MAGQIILGSDEWSQEGSALTDPAKGQREAWDRAISSQPILFPHSSNSCADFWGEPAILTFEYFVNLGNELTQRDVGVIRPHLRQKVVKENVDDDSRKSPPWRA